MSESLERIDLALRILNVAERVGLSEEELAKVKRIALAYLDAELGLHRETA